MPYLESCWWHKTAHMILREIACGKRLPIKKTHRPEGKKEGIEVITFSQRAQPRDLQVVNVWCDSQLAKTYMSSVKLLERCAGDWHYFHSIIGFWNFICLPSKVIIHDITRELIWLSLAPLETAPKSTFKNELINSDSAVVLATTINLRSGFQNHPKKPSCLI